MSKPKPAPPENCPVCGADVPRNARACPGCGADENSGWNEEAAPYDGIDLPDEEFDYDRFAERELGVNRRKPPREWLGWLLAAVIAALIILALVLRWL